MKKSYVILIIFLSSVQNIFSQVTNMAAGFNGSSTTYMSTGNISQLDSVSTFSFEAWVKINSWVENSFIFKQSASTQNRIDLQVGPLANKRFYFHIASGGNNYIAADNLPITVGSWFHVVVTYNGSNAATNQAHIYINGVAQSVWYSAGNKLLPSFTPNTTAPFIVGYSFNGNVDEAKLWNIEMQPSQFEMKNTINQYHPLYPNLIAYWKMDQPVATGYDAKNNCSLANTGSITSVAVTDNPTFIYRIVSSYIRPNLLHTNSFDTTRFKNANDLIYYTASPYLSGDLFFAYADNTAVLNNVTYASQYQGRTGGVLNFSGNGYADVGQDQFLQAADSGSTVFTFETWVYVNSWVQNSYIFNKTYDPTHFTALQLGTQKQLIFNIANGSDNYVSANATSLDTGAWHHIAVTYNGAGTAQQQAVFYVDGVAQTNLSYSNGNNLMPTYCPSVRATTLLGTNFNGYLDEARLWNQNRSASQVNLYMNTPPVIPSTDWSVSFLTSYWKVTDSLNPGQDILSWNYDIQQIKQQQNGRTGTKYRLGLMGGNNWKTIVANGTAIAACAGNIGRFLSSSGLDGVDVDFEWATTTTDWTNYSNFIKAIKDSLPSGKTFSVTLHPSYYKLTSVGIAAPDYVSIQLYGPSPSVCAMSNYWTGITNLINWGFPVNKLVAGVPYYAVSSDNTKLSTSYKSIVAQNPNLNPALDTATYNFGNGVIKNMSFNGVNTMILKSDTVVNRGMAGIMSWDLLNDVSYSNTLCLERAVNTIINANTDTIITTPITQQLHNMQTQAMVSDIGSSLVVYPNPVRNIINVVLPQNAKSVSLISQQGIKLYHQDNITFTGVPKTINAASLAAGVYILEVLLDNSQLLTCKIMKQ